MPLGLSFHEVVENPLRGVAEALRPVKDVARFVRLENLPVEHEPNVSAVQDASSDVMAKQENDQLIGYRCLDVSMRRPHLLAQAADEVLHSSVRHTLTADRIERNDDHGSSSKTLVY
jgi:hypothetical protein